MKIGGKKSHGRALAVHCCYHKCMTLYFNDVFKTFSECQGLVFQNTAFVAPEPASADILLAHDSRIDLSGIKRPWRATHIVRDPRDLLVSAYFYHLRTDEEWCAKPTPANHDLPPDVSYQQYLRSLDLAGGLLYEMRHVSGAVTESMGAWDYSNPGVLELRYEAVLGNEERWFRRLFEWYGFEAHEIEQGVEVALRFTLDNVRPGDPGYAHRNRASGVGYWRKYFSEPVIREFKQRHGDVVVRLGYEDSLEW